MEYFGTSLNEHGHYRFILEDNQMIKVNYNFEKLPFHLEQITNSPALKKGDVVFYQGGGLTVIGICGSCKDDRLGNKSIFWINQLVSREEMIERIKKHPMALRIIDAMKFEIKWNEGITELNEVWIQQCLAQDKKIESLQNAFKMLKSILNDTEGLNLELLVKDIKDILNKFVK